MKKLIAALAVLGMAPMAWAQNADDYRGGWRTEAGDPHIYQFSIRGDQVRGVYCTRCSDATTLAFIDGTLGAAGLTFTVTHVKADGSTEYQDRATARFDRGTLVISGTSGAPRGSSFNRVVIKNFAGTRPPSCSRIDTSRREWAGAGDRRRGTRGRAGAARGSSSASRRNGTNRQGRRPACGSRWPDRAGCGRPARGWRRRSTRLYSARNVETIDSGRRHWRMARLRRGHQQAVFYCSQSGQQATCMSAVVVTIPTPWPHWTTS